MRLLIVTQAVDAEDPVLGFFHAWIAAFANHADQVEVICLRKGRYYLPENVHVHSLGKERKSTWGAVYAIRFLALAWKLRNQYDCVFVHMNPEYVVLAGWWWKLKGFPVGLWYTHGTVSLRLRIAQWFADVLFTASDASLRIHSAKKRIMGHGIELPAMVPPAPSGPIRLLTIGRIARVKRLEVLLGAVSHTRIIHPEITLVVVGAPVTPEDTAYQSTLERQVEREGLAGVVVFTGAKTVPEVREELTRSHVFLHASETGSLDKAPLEALATGMPVITTNAEIAALTPAARLAHGTSEAIAAELEGVITGRAWEDEKLRAEARGALERYSLPELIERILDELSLFIPAYTGMKRILRKAQGALRNPVRAVRIIWSESAHKVVVRLFYGMRRTCDFVIAGIPFSFRTDDGYSKEWFFPRCDNGRYHEPAVTTLLATLVTKETPSFIDVGAHLGYFSVLAGKLLGERPVLAFEMDDRALLPLERNIKHNNLTNIKVIHAAITGSSGPVNYRRLPLLDSGESIAFPGSDDPSATVDGYTLDEVCESHVVEPGIIKIDVEGAEREVLKSMRATLAKKPILLLEIHGRKLGSFGSSSQEVLQTLAEDGYRAYEIVDHRTGNQVQLRELSPDEEPFTRNTMCLVVHETAREKVLARVAVHGSAREHFNSVASGAGYTTYEERRWQADPRLIVQQQQTQAFITQYVVPLLPVTGRVCELGPGPGTWSRVLAEAQPALRFVLCDISGEMLARATTVLGAERIDATHEGDFGSVDLSAERADFFFSSRAFEYLTDKEAAVRKIHAVLVPGGRGCITTKMPKPFMNRLSGRRQSALHSGQIAPHDFMRILWAQGFANIRVYPVTVAVPLLRSGYADRLAGSLLAGPLSFLSALFAESYAVSFTKP